MAGGKPTIADGMRAARDPAGPATPHPSHEELLAYHQNRLEAEAEERLQDHLAACRDCARDAADLAAFLDPAKAEELDGGSHGLTPEESEALWRDLETRRAAAVKPLAPPPPPPPPPPWYRRPAVLQAVAAVLLISTASSLTLWLMTRDRLRRLEGGAVNAALGMLAPVDFLREGELPVLEVPPGAVVVLIPAGEVPDADHEVEILTQDNRLVWSARGLRPVPPAGTFHLRLPLDLAAGTTYRIRVSAAGSGPRGKGEVYEVRIGEPGPD